MILVVGVSVVGAERGLLSIRLSEILKSATLVSVVSVRVCCTFLHGRLSFASVCCVVARSDFRFGCGLSLAVAGIEL